MPLNLGSKGDIINELNNGQKVSIPTHTHEDIKIPQIKNPNREELSALSTSDKTKKIEGLLENIKSDHQVAYNNGDLDDGWITKRLVTDANIQKRLDAVGRIIESEKQLSTLVELLGEDLNKIAKKRIDIKNPNETLSSQVDKLLEDFNNLGKELDTTYGAITKVKIATVPDKKNLLNRLSSGEEISKKIDSFDSTSKSLKGAISLLTGLKETLGNNPNYSALVKTHGKDLFELSNNPAISSIKEFVLNGYLKELGQIKDSSWQTIEATCKEELKVLGITPDKNSYPKALIEQYKKIYIAERTAKGDIPVGKPDPAKNTDRQNETPFERDKRLTDIAHNISLKIEALHQLEGRGLENSHPDYIKEVKAVKKYILDTKEREGLTTTDQKGRNIDLIELSEKLSIDPETSGRQFFSVLLGNAVSSKMLYNKFNIEDIGLRKDGLARKEVIHALVTLNNKSDPASDLPGDLLALNNLIATDQLKHADINQRYVLAKNAIINGLIQASVPASVDRNSTQFQKEIAPELASRFDKMITEASHHSSIHRMEPILQQYGLSPDGIKYCLNFKVNLNSDQSQTQIAPSSLPELIFTLHRLKLQINNNREIMISQMQVLSELKQGFTTDDKVAFINGMKENFSPSFRDQFRNYLLQVEDSLNANSAVSIHKGLKIRDLFDSLFSI